METLSKLTKSPMLEMVPSLTHGYTNLSLSKEEMSFLDSKTATAKQVHGDHLIWANHFEKRERDADGIATFSPELALGVYSADCAPVLTAALHPTSGQPFAVMAVHAGWRGTALGIAGKTLKEFITETGKKTKGARYVCAIGPCIGPQSFEVGEDVIQVFPHAEKAGLAKLLRLENGKKKYLFNLPGENLRQLHLIRAELSASVTIDSLGLCTLERREEYPSYRRDREKAGRILSFLSFRG